MKPRFSNHLIERPPFQRRFNRVVHNCRPISIQPEEIISGRAVIISSRSFSVASFETVSASGLARTFQMACWIGMGFGVNS